MALDPDYPSIVIGGPDLVIPDAAGYGRETTKPDFVRADDANFLGGPK